MRATAAKLCGYRRCRRCAALGHGKEDEHRGQKRQHDQSEEQAAPAECVGGEFGGNRCRQDAEPAHRHDAAVGQRPALGPDPQDDRLETAHQSAGTADADERAGGRQADEAVRLGKDQGADTRQGNQHRLNAARAEAVEQHPERQLEAGKGHQVGGRQQPQLAGRQTNVAHQIRAHDRVHRPVEVGQQIAERKGSEHQHGGKGAGNEFGPGGSGPRSIGSHPCFPPFAARTHQSAECTRLAQSVALCNHPGSVPAGSACHSAGRSVSAIASVIFAGGQG